MEKQLKNKSGTNISPKLESVKLEEGANLNQIFDVGNYYCDDASVVQTMTGQATNAPFSLIISGKGRINQIFIETATSKFSNIYSRNYFPSTSTWSSWVKIDGNKRGSIGFMTHIEGAYSTTVAQTASGSSYILIKTPCLRSNNVWHYMHIVGYLYNQAIPIDMTICCYIFEDNVINMGYGGTAFKTVQICRATDGYMYYILQMSGSSLYYGFFSIDYACSNFASIYTGSWNITTPTSLPSHITNGVLVTAPKKW